ncbi:MAG: hypothetical protein U9N87_11235, partial [Planctomycetota bacterium]|nr:hypothetical protein [Planctomycetota bacterium]
MYRTQPLLFFCLILLVVSILAGCGGPLPTYKAGGKVTLPDGTPMNAGQVEFRPVDSEHLVSARGAIQTDGTFELSTFEAGDGAIEGEHQVLVRPMLSAG